MTLESSIWTPAMVTVVIGGIVTLLGAVTTMIVTLHGMKAKAAATDVKIDEVSVKATEIHVLTNSNLSTVTSALQVANEKISGLEKMVASLAVSREKIG